VALERERLRILAVERRTDRRPQLADGDAELEVEEVRPADLVRAQPPELGRGAAPPRADAKVAAPAAPSSRTPVSTTPTAPGP
jgi:hypothetical protein